MELAPQFLCTWFYCRMIQQIRLEPVKHFHEHCYDERCLPQRALNKAQVPKAPCIHLEWIEILWIHLVSVIQLGPAQHVDQHLEGQEGMPQVLPSTEMAPAAAHGLHSWVETLPLLPLRRFLPALQGAASQRSKVQQDDPPLQWETVMASLSLPLLRNRPFAASQHSKVRWQHRLLKSGITMVESPHPWINPCLISLPAAAVPNAPPP
mmetsp:Transcript_153579/g.294187  ORF Transcript_153579/g.294187 Transcript_153579/m.294187 type:complete len:208 (-) Transcript_153579:488-1111(-)